jgi:ribonucleotide monophosphatase NagD (HAD superfamily)
MKFAFDFDGVISEMPELFATLTKALKAAGHEIYIVTDFDEQYRSYRENELAEFDITYDHLIITGNKQHFMQQEHIKFAFDDDPEYYKSKKRLPFYAFSNYERDGN